MSKPITLRQIAPRHWGSLSAFLFMGALALSPQPLQAQSNRPQNSGVCQTFAPQAVRLLPSRWRDNFERDSAWMMSIPVNRLLHSFQTTSGAFAGREGGYMTVKKLAGWESLDCDLRGHTTGHLLSALAMLYAQTGSSEVKAKADSLVAGLSEVQRAYGNGYLSAFGEGLIDRNLQGKSVWAPWYTLHKLAQGLIDQYTLCGNDTALAVVERMSEWAYRKLQPLSDEQRRRMIRNEFGGFNEAMYNLYAINHNPHALWLARFFYHNEKVDPLKHGISDLGTNHANTFIPKLLGEWKAFELFGDTLSRNAAELLFRTLSERHAFVTGEVSDREHLFNPDEQSRHLTGYDGENCCTYNLLKLAQRVFCYRGDAGSADYIERALWNHILGQQDPQSSMVTYFTPLLTGAYRLYSTRDSSYWCCVGSGFESHVKYATFIYTHSDDALWVNLPIASRVDWDGTVVTQQTDFPASDRVVLGIGGKSRTFTLRLRRPRATTLRGITINGRRLSDKALREHLEQDGAFLAIRRHWKKGDRIVVDYDLELHEEPMRDDSSRVALVYGPVVLAGELDPVDHPFSDPKLYNDYYTKDYQVPATLPGRCTYQSLKDFRKVGPLEWRSANGIVVKPFYDVHHHRYVVEWKKLSRP